MQFFLPKFWGQLHREPPQNGGSKKSIFERLKQEG